MCLNVSEITHTRARARTHTHTHTHARARARAQHTHTHTDTIHDINSRNIQHLQYKKIYKKVTMFLKANTLVTM